jgi:hypothetical protein
MSDYKFKLADCQTKKGVIDESVLLCMKTGIKTANESTVKAKSGVGSVNPGITSQPEERQQNLFEKLFAPSRDASNYAQNLAKNLQDSPVCSTFKDAMLEAGKGSRYEAITLYKIIKYYEEAKESGCSVSALTSGELSTIKIPTTSITQQPGTSHINHYRASTGNGFIVPIICLIVGFWLGKTRRRAEENTGEAAVRKAISKLFGGQSYHLLNNVTLPLLDGTTQIDHILVSTKGIFVIETKHYNGWIFGDAKSSKWTQVLNKNTKNPFQNPIHQNYLHVKTIQRMLDFVPNDCIHSMVVFTGEAIFKTAVPPNVYSLQGLIKSLREFKDDVLTETNFYLSVGRLECKRREISGKTDVEHVAHLNKKFGGLR